MQAAATLWLVACGAAVPFAQQQTTYGIAALSLTHTAADKVVELGANTVRVPFAWDTIEAECKGCFNFASTDRWRDEARRTGRAIYGLIAYAPRWANGGHTYNYPPLNYRDWYDFVYAVASRYRDDVVQWGIWNEPNLDKFLHGGDTATYRQLVTTAREAIHAANQEARVFGPEVSWHGVRDGWFAAAMQSFGDLFDVVTVHWYADAPSMDFLMDEWVHPQALGKSVWLTEAGYKPCGSLFGEATQAAIYDRVLKALAPRRAWWTGVIFYNLNEAPGEDECGWGITRQDWSNRPAFLVYQSFISTHPADEPCCGPGVTPGTAFRKRDDRSPPRRR